MSRHLVFPGVPESGSRDLPFEGGWLKHAWLCGSLIGMIAAVSTGLVAQAPANDLPVVTSVAEYYLLSPDQLKQGRPVRIVGVSVYGDPEWRMLFLMDATGMLYVSLPVPAPGTGSALESGDEVQIQGRTAVVNGGPGFTNLELRVLGPGRLSTPVSLTAREMVAPERGATYARVRGVVRLVSDEDRLRLILVVDGQPFEAWVRKYSPTDLAGLLDARVQVDALCARKFNDQGKKVGAVLYIPSLRSIQVEEPGPSDAFAAAVIPIRTALARADAAKQESSRVRIQGAVSHQVLGEYGVVSDETGSIRCFSPQNLRLSKDQRVDVLGIPTLDQGERKLTYAVFRPVAEKALSVPPPAPPGEPASELPVLDQARTVHRLSPEEAQRRYPVKLRGVVTYHDAAWQTLFIQDASGGIFVEPGPFATPFPAGQRVEVTGVTDPGGYKPMVVKARITVIGAGELPVPAKLSSGLGQTGDHDCRWVEIEGIVRTAALQNDHLFFDVSSGEGIFRCCLPRLTTSSLRTNLVGAMVRVQGVCAVTLNKARLFAGLGLNVPDEAMIQVVERPPEDAFSLPGRPIGVVLRSLLAQLDAGLVKIRGTVTLVQPGLGMVVQDSSGGMYVATQETDRVSVGDEVDALGFHCLGDYTPFLEHARIRGAPRGAPLVPKHLTAERVLAGENNYELVVLEARLLDEVSPSRASELVLQDGAVIFTASVETSQPISPSRPLQAGSVLRLVGVCSIKAGELRQPKAFRLLLRSPADVTVVKHPPFFSRSRILGLAGVMGLTVAATLGWVLALRVRLQRQTEQIRQRMEREAALEARYRDLVEQNPAAIIITDIRGNIEYVNPKFTRITGYTRQEVIGQNPRMLKSGENPPERYVEMWEAITAGREWQGEFSNLTKHGQPYRVSSLISPLKNEAGEIVNYIAIQEDVSQRHSLKLQLRQAQKMESIGQLAAGVAHDFNNLLTVIQGHTSLLQEDPRLPGGMAESIEEIAASSRRAAELTRQLLAFARKQVMRTILLDINQVVMGVAKMLQRLLGENIALSVHCEPRLPTVRADSGMMEQVIINLAVNARDAMPGGGLLTLRTRLVVLEGRPAGPHSDAKPGTFVCLTVGDDGCGMTPEIVARLFEPFFTTKDQGKGTGLGLATVYGIVRQHGGWIAVSSEPGRGTVFSVHLPVDGTPLARDESCGEPDLPRGKGQTVLIAEDEANVRALAARLIERQGYRVLQAVSGKDALRVWAGHAAEVDLLLTDMVMPEGISGLDLARRLGAEKPALRVIYSSGYSAELAARGTLDLQEGVSFLQKPYTARRLLESVGAALQGVPAPAVPAAAPGPVV